MTASKSEILDFIRERPRLFDGGTGSKLFALGWTSDKCPEAAPPEIITRIHADYLEAGAEILTTNTFGGTRHKLDNYAMGAQVCELNRRNAALAGAAGGNDRPHFVAGDLGPTGQMPEPYGDWTFDDFYAQFREQAEGLREGGAGLFIVETMTTPEELQAAVKAVRDVVGGAAAIIGSMTFNAGPGGYRTMAGTSVADAARIMLDAGCDVIGSNCTIGPDDFVGLIAEFRAAAPGAPILAEPNAGQPRLVEGRTVYALADGWEAHVRAILDAGANLIGGCCGTDEAYIRAVRKILDERN